MSPAEHCAPEAAGRRNVVTLGLVSFFNDTATDMVYWLLPQFLVGVLGARPGILGLIEGVAESVASFSKLGSGYLADRFGRRKPLVVAGYVLANVAKPLLAVSQAWWHVLAIRFADRLGKGIRTAPRDVMIVESVTANARGSAFGLRQAMDSAGAIAGPLAALALLPLIAGNLRTLFWLAAIPGAVSVLLAIFTVRETKSPMIASTESLAKRGPADAVEARTANNLPGFSTKYYLLLAAVGLFGLANSSDLFLILRAQNLGAPAALAPAFGLVFNLVYTALAWPAGKLSDRVPRKRVIASGYLLFAGTYLGFAVIQQPQWVWGLFAIYGMYYAFSEGTLRALVADLVPSSRRGTAYGWVALVTTVTLLPSSLLAGFLWEHFGPATPFYFSACVSLIATFLIALL